MRETEELHSDYKSSVKTNKSLIINNNEKTPLLILQYISSKSKLDIAAPRHFSKRKFTNKFMRKAVEFDLKNPLFESSGKDEVLFIEPREYSKKKIHPDLIMLNIIKHSSEKTSFTDKIIRALIKKAVLPILIFPFRFEANSISKVIYLTNLNFNEIVTIKYIIKFAQLNKAKVSIFFHRHETENNKLTINQLKSIILSTNSTPVKYEETTTRNFIREFLQVEKKQNVPILAMSSETLNYYDNKFSNSLSQKLLFQKQIPLLALNKKEAQSIFLG